jgi:DNA topoisomerase-3
VKENYRRFACEKCEFSISKIPGGAPSRSQEVEEFLTHKRIGRSRAFAPRPAGRSLPS